MNMKKRPKLKTKLIILRVTPKERKALDLEAKRSGQTISHVLMRPWRKTEVDMEKNLEGRLRRKAKKHGLSIKRDRAQSISADHLGGYMIIDASRNLCLAGEKFDIELDQLEEALDLIIKG
jgi:hypothetical protein